MGIDRKAIAAEAKRRSLADDGKTSKSERFAIRNAIRAEQGYAPEKRTRGGIAGAYDRNKDYIVPAASILAGLIPGVNAAVPALLGAARGFDRPGEGGIGFDLGTGLAGAASGYGLGQVGGAIGDLAGLGAPASVPGALRPLPAPGALSAESVGAGLGAALPSAGTAATTAAAPAAKFSLGSALGKVGGFLKGNHGANALAAIQAVTGALEGKKAADLADRAVAVDARRYAQNAPLRDAGRAGMLNPQPSQDTSGLIPLSGQGNPFARRVR